jgi:tetratricopeptide (TPR) repeat protein
LIFVNMQRRAVEKKPLYNQWRDNKNYVHTTYISRTQAFVRGSVRSVDLATARIFSATVLEASPVRENTIQDQCCAEFPSEYDVLDAATAQVVGQATRLFLPWTETVPLVYFDDDDCSLKAAHARHKAGDIEGALRQSLANLDQCKAMPKANAKTLSHADHNVGIGYFALGQYDKAIEYLEEAQRVRPAGIYTEAIAACRKADALAHDMQRVEERMSVAAEAAEAKKVTAANAEAAQTLTNNDILSLAKAKLPAEVITSKIKTSACRFDTSADALIQLKQAGVPDSVIIAMMECGKK